MSYLCYFNENNEFTAAMENLYRGMGQAPSNALELEAIPAQRAGFALVLNAAKTGFDYIVDHRQKYNERGQLIEGSGTAYWLDSDKWDSAARYMSSYGDLPNGALLNTPQKTAEEIKEERITEIKQELTRLEAIYLPARTLSDLVAGNEHSLERKRQFEEIAEPLRAELRKVV